MVSDAFLELISFSNKAKIIHAIDKFAETFDSVQLLDGRTEEMFLSYEFYKHNPQNAYNIVSYVWFIAYNLIKQYQPRMF